MKVDLRIPLDFDLFDEGDDEDHIFIYDEYGDVKRDIKEAIYQKPFFSHLVVDERHYCYIWWNDTLGYWCGEVWGSDYIETYLCETLEELRVEIMQSVDAIANKR
ncbi:hypothetical protein SAMN05518672_114155 [Chitinophaga sp. CF118]|uniref:hypothetical protein n=1 Tax=Chitinophaga sp. CF118 TaxID=1884367 RepID=UPI0008EBEAA5|nr:hypothetical protein [Chitinophaga sp. CF118]SFF03865.1 hypothetical protein SAMN05518672_114155 [Chitinophaga sp. CF118]